MTDLYRCYPSSTLPLDDTFEELLGSFQTTGLTTTDLLTLDPIHIAQICDRSAVEVRKFLKLLEADVYNSLVLENGKTLFEQERDEQTHITTGDEELDSLLGDGVPVGSLTEISGQSASGKSHFLLQLAATVQLDPSQGGLGKSAIYISTESGGLETRRLQDIIEGINERYTAAVSDSNVRCFNCYDTEELIHIMQYQLPLAIEKHNVGVVLIDSIAAHYRAEAGNLKNESDALSRTQSLTTVARLLRTMAQKYKLAVLVANQVADRFSKTLDKDQKLDPFMFDHQLRWYSGWTNESIVTSSTPSTEENQPARTSYSIFDSFDERTDGNSFTSAGDALKQELEALSDNLPQKQEYIGPTASQHASECAVPSSQPSKPDYPYTLPRDFGKVPALGLVWANEIDQRIVLKRESVAQELQSSPGSTSRTLEVVFSPWCAPSKIGFRIVTEGIQALT